MLTRRITIAASLFALSLVPALAQKKYDVGANDKEIKVGHIGPYSGPASAYGTIGKSMAAYFKMLNEKGGINGRKINFISYDDSYSPPKAIEQSRKLVESDEVLFLFQPLGTANNLAIMKYMNEQKVPQLFTATGATAFGIDPVKNPWTMGWQPHYQGEGRIFAKYLLAEKPNAKIGVLYQNDDYGKDVLKGLKDGLGAKAASMIKQEVTYEVTDPTVDSQIVKLQSSGVDVFVNIATPRAAAQGIKKMAELGWKPMHLLNNVSNSIGAVLRPAGLDNAKNIISINYAKDTTDPKNAADPAVIAYKEFMSKYYPEGDVNSTFNAYGMMVATTVSQVIKQAGDELTRANIMKQAASLKNFELGLLLSGIKINTSPTDFFPIEQMQLMKFNGANWEYFGSLYDGSLK